MPRTRLDLPAPRYTDSRESSVAGSRESPAARNGPSSGRGSFMAQPSMRSLDRRETAGPQRNAQNYSGFGMRKDASRREHGALFSRHEADEQESASSEPDRHTHTGGIPVRRGDAAMLMPNALTLTQQMFRDNHLMTDRSGFTKSTDGWSGAQFEKMPEEEGAQEDLADHLFEIHSALASAGAASQEGRFRANQIVRSSLSNKPKHNVRRVWDACMRQIETDWQHAPSDHFPVLTALAAFHDSYTHPRAAKHAEDMLAAVRWDPNAKVATNERHIIERLRTAQQVASATRHLERRDRLDPMTNASMVSFLLHLVPVFMKEHMEKLPKGTPNETWDEVVKELTLAQEQKDRERGRQGRPGGGQPTGLATLGQSVPESALALRFMCEAMDSYPEEADDAALERFEEEARLLALRVLECWRCGGPHAKAQCLAKPSAQEADGAHWKTWPKVAQVPNMGTPRTSANYAAPSGGSGAPRPLVSAGGYLAAAIGPPQTTAPAALGPPGRAPSGRGVDAYRQIQHGGAGAAPLLTMTSGDPNSPLQDYDFYNPPPEVPSYVPNPALRSQVYALPGSRDAASMAELIKRMDAFDIETANREQVRRQMHLEVHRYLEDQPANVISHLAALQQEQPLLDRPHADLHPYALPGRAPVTFERAGVWSGDNQTELFMQQSEVRRISDTVAAQQAAYARAVHGDGSDVWHDAEDKFDGDARPHEKRSNKKKNEYRGWP